VLLKSTNVFTLHLTFPIVPHDSDRQISVRKTIRLCLCACVCVCMWPFGRLMPLKLDSCRINLPSMTQRSASSTQSPIHTQTHTAGHRLSNVPVRFFSLSCL
jgi:hypothetical protein